MSPTDWKQRAARPEDGPQSTSCPPPSTSRRLPQQPVAGTGKRREPRRLRGKSLARKAAPRDPLPELYLQMTPLRLPTSFNFDEEGPRLSVVDSTKGKRNSTLDEGSPPLCARFHSRRHRIPPRHALAPLVSDAFLPLDRTRSNSSRLHAPSLEVGGACLTVYTSPLYTTIEDTAPFPCEDCVFLDLSNGSTSFPEPVIDWEDSVRVLPVALLGERPPLRQPRTA